MMFHFRFISFWLKFFDPSFIFKGLLAPCTILFRWDLSRGVLFTTLGRWCGPWQAHHLNRGVLFTTLGPSLITLLLCCFVGLPAFAGEEERKASEKALSPAAAEGRFQEEQRASYSTEAGLNLIVVKVPQLRLKVRARGKASRGAAISTTAFSSLNLKWKGGDASVEQKDGILTVESGSFSSREAWDGPKEKPLVLEISGGATTTLPLQIFARSIQASVAYWDQPVFISAFEGSLNALGNTGPWQISLKDGELNVQRHKGQFALKGSHLRVLVSESQGSFKSRLNEGALKLKKWQGSLDFITHRADVRLQKFKGNLKGESQSGRLQGSIQPENVEWSSRQGDIRLTFIKQAPKVTAYTQRGKIYGARHLGREFSGKSTKILGWLKGRPKKGLVRLNSETGNIYLN